MLGDTDKLRAENIHLVDRFEYNLAAKKASDEEEIIGT